MVCNVLSLLQVISNHASGKGLQADSPSFDPPAVPSGGDSLKIQVGGLPSTGWIAVIDTQGNSRNPGSCLSTMAPWSCYQIGKFVHVYATTKCHLHRGQANVPDVEARRKDIQWNFKNGNTDIAVIMSRRCWVSQHWPRP